MQIISSYRSPATNAILHAKSDGVATLSLHLDGKAVDIRIPGRNLCLLRQTALAMKAGGVGLTNDGKKVVMTLPHPGFRREREVPRRVAEHLPAVCILQPENSGY